MSTLPGAGSRSTVKTGLTPGRVPRVVEELVEQQVQHLVEHDPATEELVAERTAGPTVEEPRAEPDHAGLLRGVRPGVLLRTALGDAAVRHRAPACQFLGAPAEAMGDNQSRRPVAGPRDWPRRVVTEEGAKQPNGLAAWGPRLQRHRRVARQLDRINVRLAHDRPAAVGREGRTSRGALQTKSWALRRPLPRGLPLGHHVAPADGSRIVQVHATPPGSRLRSPASGAARSGPAARPAHAGPL